MLKFHRRPRKKSSLVIGAVSLIFLVGLVVFFPPDSFFVKTLFFLLFFTGFFYLSSFILNHTRQAFFISIGLTLILVLRSIGLRHWLYPILTIAIILTSEMYFRQKQ